MEMVDVFTRGEVEFAIGHHDLGPLVWVQGEEDWRDLG